MIRAVGIGLALAACILPLDAAYAAKNPANDYLMSQSASAQASLLSKAIGRGCVARSAFFMGMGAPGFPKNQALWSAKCSNGASFAVKINPDGTNQSMECTVFQSLNPARCFKKVETPK